MLGSTVFSFGEGCRDQASGLLRLGSGAVVLLGLGGLVSDCGVTVVECWGFGFGAVDRLDRCRSLDLGFRLGGWAIIYFITVYDVIVYHSRLHFYLKLLYKKQRVHDKG